MVADDRLERTDREHGAFLAAHREGHGTDGHGVVSRLAERGNSNCKQTMNYLYRNYIVIVITLCNNYINNDRDLMFRAVTSRVRSMMTPLDFCTSLAGNSLRLLAEILAVRAR